MHDKGMVKRLEQIANKGDESLKSQIDIALDNCAFPCMWISLSLTVCEIHISCFGSCTVTNRRVMEKHSFAEQIPSNALCR